MTDLLKSEEGKTWLWRSVSSVGKEEWGLGYENSCDLPVAQRMVNLDAILSESNKRVLEAVVEMIDERKVEAKSLKQASDLLIYDLRKGLPLNYKTLEEIVRRACDERQNAVIDSLKSSLKELERKEER